VSSVKRIPRAAHECVRIYRQGVFVGETQLLLDDDSNPNNSNTHHFRGDFMFGCRTQESGGTLRKAACRWNHGHVQPSPCSIRRS
jgi:hypothetical protein